ncbi:hypothetical protein RBSWK_04451 [Rhodopirellula baltica SWK14]|uniref:Uncharacterized protein n=1 Tax=Rhodopirellula baltica SWK14 TaxID=993516 RepID=L7CCC2_RHOBT|nr:hypothetical protein RBSWK_04451 [Rhodopirellula baltica SWK14]
MINPGSVNEPVHAAKLVEGERLVDANEYPDGMKEDGSRRSRQRTYGQR